MKICDDVILEATIVSGKIIQTVTEKSGKGNRLSKIVTVI